MEKLFREKKAFKINETTADENSFLKLGIGPRRYRFKLEDFLTDTPGPPSPSPLPRAVWKGTLVFPKAFRGGGGCFQNSSTTEIRQILERGEVW